MVEYKKYHHILIHSLWKQSYYSSSDYLLNNCLKKEYILSAVMWIPSYSQIKVRATECLAIMIASSSKRE